MTFTDPSTDVATLLSQLPKQPPSGAGTVDPNQSAQQVLKSMLDNYGLGTLADQLWNQYLAGAPQEQILSNMRATPEYQARFPGMSSLAASGHAITETQYMDLEKQYTQVLRTNGLPSGFYDQPSDFANFITNQVSPSELQNRVANGYAAVANAPDSVKSAFQQFYGIGGNGALASYFLDPTKAEPLLTKQVEAAQFAGQAQNTAGLGVSQTTAETVAGSNISSYFLRNALDKLGNMGNPTQDTFGEGQSGSHLSADQAVLGAVGLGGGTAQVDLARRLAGRVSEFAGNPQEATVSQQGVTGVGGSQRE